MVAYTQHVPCPDVPLLLNMHGEDLGFLCVLIQNAHTNPGLLIEQSCLSSLISLNIEEA